MIWDPKTFLKEHWLTLALVAVLLGLGTWAKCRPAPVRQEQKAEAKVETHEARAEEKKQEIKKDVKKTRERFRPDGSLASRTVTQDGTMINTKVEVVEVVKTVETVKTVTIKEPVRVDPFIGIQATPLWDRVQAKPTDLLLSADFKLKALRVGPAVHWRTDEGLKPHAYGVTLRAEF